jgi:hypothetical protein
MTTLTRWKEQRRPLARAVDLPMRAIVMTIEITGIVLIAFLASRI